jgi:dienelactone hydrolase
MSKIALNEDIGVLMDYFEMMYKFLRVNVLVVAYRGFSNSDGYHTETGLDALNILNYATSNPLLDSETIFVLGRGLGAAVAAYGMTTEPGKLVRGFICEHTFSSLKDQVNITFPKLKHIIALV